MIQLLQINVLPLQVYSLPVYNHLSCLTVSFWQCTVIHHLSCLTVSCWQCTVIHHLSCLTVSCWQCAVIHHLSCLTVSCWQCPVIHYLSCLTVSCWQCTMKVLLVAIPDTVPSECLKAPCTVLSRRHGLFIFINIATWFGLVFHYQNEVALHLTPQD